MATIQIAARPDSIDGCFANWSEHDAEAVLRSEMDMGGFVKVRRRTTAASWLVEANVNLEASLYQDVMDWYRVACQRGVLPTRVKRPDGKEVVMRMTAAPVIQWPERDRSIFTLTLSLEQLPQWATL